MPCVNHPEVIDGLNPCSRCGKTFCGDCLVELKGGRFCANCKTEQVKDIKSGVDARELPLAHLGRRFVAILLDTLIFMSILMPIAMALGFFATQDFGGSAPGAVGPQLGIQLGFQMIFWLIPMAYKALMTQWRGQTLGKMAMGIKVVSADGAPATPGQAWIRALVESLLAGCCYITYIVAFFRKDKCTIHDMAARTRVIRLPH